MNIPDYTHENFSESTVIMRMIDGLGFRYYWATKGLRESDLDYNPGHGARSMRETIEHIYSLSYMISQTAQMKSVIRSESRNFASTHDYEEIRNKTLFNLETARKSISSLSPEELSNLVIVFQNFPDAEPSAGSSIYKLINGPIADALTHVGQVITFRRIAGNPQPQGVNQFQGKKTE